IGSGATPLPAAILRTLYEGESIGPNRFEFYDLALAIETARTEFEGRLGRMAQDWELTSAIVDKTKQDVPETTLSNLHKAYAGLEDATDQESLSADARLADQVYRLGARLCIDGCRGCVHQPSELMSDSLVETSVSRRMLGRFLCS